MRLDFRWVVVATLVLAGFAFVTVSVNRRAAQASQDAARAEAQAALIAERQLRDEALTLCRSTVVARRDGNERNRALHDYLVSVLQINQKVQKLQPTPVVLRPLVRQELAAAHLLVRELKPLPIPACPSNGSAH